MLLIIIGLGWLLKEGPAVWKLEHEGKQEIGLLDHYDIHHDRHVGYVPVVSVLRDGERIEVRGREQWGSQWYNVGDRVVMVSLPGYDPIIGSFFLRCSGLWLSAPFLILGCVALSLELICCAIGRSDDKSIP